MYLAIGKFKLDNPAVAYTDTRHYGINEIFQYGSLCLSGELFKINASFLQCSKMIDYEVNSSIGDTCKTLKDNKKPLSIDRESYAKGLFVGEQMTTNNLSIALSIAYDMRLCNSKTKATPL
jgi:hypothetical protein